MFDHLHFRYPHLTSPWSYHTNRGSTGQAILERPITKFTDIFNTHARNSSLDKSFSMFVINTRRSDRNSVYQGNHYLPRERRTDLLLWRNLRCSLMNAKHIPLHQWLTSGGVYESRNNLSRLVTYALVIGGVSKQARLADGSNECMAWWRRGPIVGPGTLVHFLDRERFEPMLHACDQRAVRCKFFRPTLCAYHAM